MEDVKRKLTDVAKMVFSLLFGFAILYWMYRGFDFNRVKDVLLNEMGWAWMLLSFPFGIMAQAFRGWRWRQSLEPLGEKPRLSVAIHAIFLSYASSLVIPRIGEFARCEVLRRWDGISFPKSLGTVVTERVIDSLLIALITAFTFLTQVPVFMTFFDKTGTSMDSILNRFTTTGYIVTAACGIAACLLIYFLLRTLSLHHVVKDTLRNIWQGIISLRNVRNVPLYIVFTFAIWCSYFLHYYLTFFCFDETSQLGVMSALVTFIVGSIAVIVPTPNGAGSWHFAVKTMLILYGVSQDEALYFVLIVHAVQTLLVVLLGIYAWIALAFTKKHNNK